PESDQPPFTFFTFPRVHTRRVLRILTIFVLFRNESGFSVDIQHCLCYYVKKVLTVRYGFFQINNGGRRRKRICRVNFLTNFFCPFLTADDIFPLFSGLRRGVPRRT
ncbi:MAG: hypothetical protein IJK23_06420, partial [Clostridia bacterium]|nr:hypothetical protein [Clostridia bacterium]